MLTKCLQLKVDIHLTTSAIICYNVYIGLQFTGNITMIFDN